MRWRSCSASSQVKAAVLRDGADGGDSAGGGGAGRRRRCSRPATPSPATACSSNRTDLFVDEATLTGETFPVEKTAGVLPADTPLAARTNALFMGTHVVSGTAARVVVHTGAGNRVRPASPSGSSSDRRRPSSRRGVRRFGYLSWRSPLFWSSPSSPSTSTCKPARPGLLPLLPGARRRPDPAAAARDHQHQPRPRRPAHGRQQGHRQAARLHRELRQHERPVLRQDGHAHRGHRPAPRRPGHRRQRKATGPAVRLSQRLLRDGIPQPDRRGHPRRRPIRHRRRTKSSTRCPTTSCASA